MKRFIFVSGLLAGYVLGARAGRGRYETIARTTRKLSNRPVVHNATSALHAQATHAARIAMGRRHRHDLASHISPN